MADEIMRDLGSHGAKIERLERDVAAIRQDVAAIRQTLDQTRGSVKMLVGVASVSGAVGAGFVKALAWLKGAA